MLFIMQGPGALDSTEDQGGLQDMSPETRRKEIEELQDLGMVCEDMARLHSGCEGQVVQARFLYNGLGEFPQRCVLTDYLLPFSQLTPSRNFPYISRERKVAAGRRRRHSHG